MLMKAISLVDQFLTRYSLIEDENNYFRSEIHSLSKEILNFKHKTPKY